MTSSLILRTLILPSAALLAVTCASAQAGPITLPVGTQLPVRLPRHLPMKAGEPIGAELIYPVYADSKLVLPARTIIMGTVVSLTPNKPKRLTSRLRADFTPYHTPVVRFSSIVAPDGTSTAITTGEATDGAPIYRVVRTPKPAGGFIGRYFQIGLGYLDDTIQAIIGPDKADRALQFIYSQLPYHPERIAKATAWTVETAAPLSIAPMAAPPPVPEPTPSRFRLVHARALASSAPPPDAPGERPTWILQAYLDDAISSEFSHAAQPIRATVAEPVMNPDGSVAVPTGAVLTGTVTQARPARHFDRAGTLRFSFTEIKLPGEETQRVRTTLAGADSTGSAQINLNAEGQPEEKPQDKILVPALLVLLATRPLDRDHGGEHHMIGKDAAAGSGLGLISLIVSSAAQQPNFSVAIGAYSAAIAIYPRYFGKGAKVAFPKDTRIVIQTTATKSAALKPSSTTVDR